MGDISKIVEKTRKISTFYTKISQSLKEYIWAAFAVLFLKKIA